MAGPVGASFAHLHLHTEFSMLDGAARVEEVVKRAASDGQPAIAITDHGNMYGVLDFYKAAQDSRHQAHHRDRGVHGGREPAGAPVAAGAGSTTPVATPTRATSSITT